MSMDDFEVDEPPADKDDFMDPLETFPSKYHESTSVALGMGNSIVMNLQLCGDKLCAASDSGTINVYSADTLSKVTSFRPQDDDVVTGVSDNPSDLNLLTTSSSMSVRIWDLRQTSQKPVKSFGFTGKVAKEHSQGEKKPFTCIAVNNLGTIAAGTEQASGEAYLLFWDLRTGSDLKSGFWDSHNDDVTTVKFHAEKNDFLATGSTDGQVNVLDLSETDEDEALVTSHNTEDSVAQVVWYSRKGNNSQLAIRTHTEEIQLWHIDSVSPHTILSRADLCHGIRRSVAEHTYIAGLYPAYGEEGLVTLVGSGCASNPCIRLGRIRNKKIKPMAMLGTRKGSVRCSVAMQDNCVTGGEDGVIRFWKKGCESEAPQKFGKVKSKAKNRELPY